MAKISTYARKAKAIRKKHPNMSWQSAMKAAAHGGAVGKRRRKSVGSTGAVGKTRKGRRRISGTGKDLMKQVVPMAVGMAAGVGAQHFLLRPLESKIAARFPMAAKFMAAGEIILGGYVALKAKNTIVKGVGLGIMAGGVQTGVKQLNIYHESPAVQGVGDYTTIHIPVNGHLHKMLNGIIDDRHGDTYTSLVAGSRSNYKGEDQEWQNDRIKRTNLLAGLYGLGEAEEENFLQVKGANF